MGNLLYVKQEQLNKLLLTAPFIMQEIKTQENFKAAISCKVFITLKLQIF
jgi:hypothetical protein